ncbi:MAG: TetR/AcrR family transcriptional regulator [Rhodothermia bacterium]
MNKQNSRREQEREARRLRMLQAARSVFAERGFRQATLDEIAQRSEFGKGTIYNYFPEGKNEMLFAILDGVYDDIYAISVEAFAGGQNGSFRQSLKRYIQASLDYFLKEEDLFVIVMKEANRLTFGDDPRHATYFKEQFGRIRGVLEPRIEVAIQSGELKPFAPHTIAHMIMGNIHGYLRCHCLTKIGLVDSHGCETPSSGEAARFISEMLLDGLAQPSNVASFELEAQIADNQV